MKCDVVRDLLPSYADRLTSGGEQQGNKKNI